MDFDDLSEFGDFLPSWQSLLWIIVGIVVGVVTYKILEPWRFAGWSSIGIGLAVAIAGRIWHARRDSA